MDGHARQEQQTGDAPEFYLENGCVVFTAACHLKRGACCGSGCRHCPFEPRHQVGAKTVAAGVLLSARRSA